KGKSGGAGGAYAWNPATGGGPPVGVVDYVLTPSAPGAIGGGRGGNQGGGESARRFGLPIIEVVQGGDMEKEAYVGDGPHVNSGFLDGLHVADAKKKMISWLEEHGHGEGTVTYKLRDWLFSRQRYWGEPFPVIHVDGEPRRVDPN